MPKVNTKLVLNYGGAMRKEVPRICHIKGIECHSEAIGLLFESLPWRGLCFGINLRDLMMFIEQDLAMHLQE